MNERLKKYIDELFKDAPDNARTQEYKEEIYRNNEEKLNDLIAEGMDAEEAFQTVAAGMGDMNEFFESLKEERGEDAIAPQPETVRSAPEPKKKRRISKAAVVFIVIGGILLLLFALSFAGVTVYRVVNKMEMTEIRVEEPAPEGEPSGVTVSEPVDTILIDWVAGEVNLIPSDMEEIYFKELADGIGMQKMHYRINDGMLSIQFAQSSILFPLFNTAKTLDVYIPRHMLDDASLEVEVSTVSADIRCEELSLHTAEFSTTSGNVRLNGFSAEGLTVSTTSGQLELLDVQCPELTADSISGKITARAAFERGDFTSVSGAVLLVLRDKPETLAADTVSGKINITLPEDSGFILEHDSVSGGLTSDFPLTLADKEGYYICGDGGETKIEADTISGEVALLLP